MSAQPHVHVGRSVLRREDRRLLAGRGRFVADLAGPATLHAAFLRSPHAHARIVAVDGRRAASHPGVVAVVTGRELADRGVGPLALLHRPDPGFAAATGFELADPMLPCLAAERVTYVGEPLAAVVASSRRVAEDALELIDVEYEPLPAYVDPFAAFDAPPIRPHLESNVAASIEASFGDVAVGHDDAAVTVEETYSIGRHGAMPLETRGVYARFDDRRDRVELWTSTQIPHLVRRVVCSATGWSAEQLRVAVPEVGGGFGTKANVYGEEVVVAVLARMLRREVAWMEDRAEHLIAAAQGRDQVHSARLSVARDGRILAWEDDFVVNVGAGSLWTAGIVANTAIHLMGPYRVPSFRARGRAAFTNKAIVAQYRGAGRPEACFALERSLDHAARSLDITPEEIRRRNLLTGEDFPYARDLPYRDGVPIVYDGGDYLRCFDSCLEVVGDEEVERLRKRHPGLRVGRGTGAYLEATGRGPYEVGRVRLLAGGRLEVAAGAASAGQGHETTLAQVAADAVGVDLEAVAVVNGDTDMVGDGVGTFASRSAVLAGNAVKLAADALVRRARELAGRLLDVAGEDLEVSGEGLAVTPDGPAISWAGLADALRPGGRLADEPPLDHSARFEPPTVTWTAGAHAAVVGVDPDTGIASVLAYAVAHEGGIDINPQIVEGQIIGGVAQGVGGSLLEEFRYDGAGQPLSGTLAEYLVPSSHEAPPVAVRHFAVPTDGNPLGVRGAGESGVIPVYAVLAAAIEDAIGASDRRLVSTPVDPETVLETLDARVVGAVA